MEKLNRCPICNSLLKDEEYLRSEDFLITKKEFVVVKCENCTVLITNPRPRAESLEQYYISEEYISHTESKKSFTDKIYHLVKARMINKKINLIKRYLNQKAIYLLDFGCGTGEFLKECKSKGWKTMGYEPSESAREKATNKGIVVKGDVSEIKNNERGKYNVITLWHVLEHVTQPKETIEKLISELEVNGILIIAIPEHKSYDAKYYGKYWAAYDLPRHLFHFNKQSLENLFAHCNLKFLKQKAMPYDSYYISYLSERNKGRSNIAAIILGLVVGLYSNMKALFLSIPYSSSIYIFRKNQAE